MSVIGTGLIVLESNLFMDAHSMETPDIHVRGIPVIGHSVFHVVLVFVFAAMFNYSVSAIHAFLVPSLPPPSHCTVISLPSVESKGPMTS